MPTAVEAPESLYDVIFAASRKLRSIADDRGIDSESLAEALDQTEKALAGTWEFLANKITSAVIDVIDGGKANAITYADVGRILLHADAVRARAEEIIEEMAKLNVAMYD